MIPFHQHDCDNCVYLGSDEESSEEKIKTDYYFCHRQGEHPCLATLIARYGEHGDYSSGSDFVMSSIGLNKALKLAVEQNVLPDDVKLYIKNKQDQWFDYCKGDLEYTDGISKRWEGRERFIIK